MWGVGVLDLMDVPGIGEKRAEQLIGALNGTVDLGIGKETG